MRDLAMAGQLQHIDVADQVGMDIGARIIDRIAHPGLRAIL